jgi:hypothetical protein
MNKYLKVTELFDYPMYIVRDLTKKMELETPITDECTAYFRLAQIKKKY